MRRARVPRGQPRDPQVRLRSPVRRSRAPDSCGITARAPVVLGGDDIAVGGAALASAYVALAVHLDQTVVTDADPAEDAARTPLRGGETESKRAAGENDPREALPGNAVGRYAVDGDGDRGGWCGFDRIVTEREQSCRHGQATAARYGASEARAAEYGAASMRVGRPSIRSRMSSAVARLRPMPAPSCPVACQSPGIRGSSLITGRWSGINGRNPP